MGLLKLLKRGAGLVLVFAVVACSGVPVSQDYALDYDFSAVTSYAWVKPDGPGSNSDPLYDSLMHERYRQAIEAQMALRGLAPAPAEKAAVLLSYHVGSVDKTRIESVGSWYSHFGYYPCYHCYHRPGFGYAHFHDDDIWVREYTEDRVVIDIVDADKRRLIWRGSAKRIQPTLSDPAARRAYIDETVANILSQFPPAPEQ